MAFTFEQAFCFSFLFFFSFSLLHLLVFRSLISSLHGILVLSNWPQCIPRQQRCCDRIDEVSWTSPSCYHCKPPFPTPWGLFCKGIVQTWTDFANRVPPPPPLFPLSSMRMGRIVRPPRGQAKLCQKPSHKRNWMKGAISHYLNIILNVNTRMSGGEIVTLFDCPENLELWIAQCGSWMTASLKSVGFIRVQVLRALSSARALLPSWPRVIPTITIRLPPLFLPRPLPLTPLITLAPWNTPPSTF